MPEQRVESSGTSHSPPAASPRPALRGPLALAPVPVVRDRAGTLGRRLPVWKGVPDDAGELVVAGEESGILDSAGGEDTLGEVFRADPSQLVGRGWSVDRGFPVSVRVLDIAQDQPLMVHPFTASGRGGNTRFWFCLDAGPGGRIAAGLRMRVTRRQFLERLDSGDLESLLQIFPARPGDAFLIPPGRVYQVWAPVLLLEIQQHAVPAEVITSAAPGGGTSRDALLAGIRFIDRHVSRISGDVSPTRYTRRIPLTPHCPAFLVEELRLAPDLRDRTTGRTFHLLVAVRGTVHIRGERGTCRLQPVQAAWIPARQQAYTIEAEDGPAVVLRAMLP